MSKIAEYFENKRADNLKEAINLFEEEKHRWKIEEIQLQQMEHIASIRRSAAISAGANVATAINSFQ